MAPQQSSNSRFTYLDGMRGIAALAVLFHHFILGFEPQLAGTILHGCVHGSFAVCIFFVLSGFVMSAAAQRPEALGLRCFKRYLRLGLPMLAAAFAAWLLLLVFPTASRNLAPLTGSPWAGQYSRPQVPLWYVPIDSLARPFLRRQSYLDTSLWTMQPELIGSLAIFFIYAFRRSGIPFLGAALLTFIGFEIPNYWLICFAAGIVFWEAKLYRIQNASGVGLIAIVTGCLLSVVSGPLLARLPASTDPWPLYMVASILMIGGILVSDSPKRWLQTRVPQFLGRISFGLYLIHVPVLLTIFAALWASWQPSGFAIAGFVLLYVVTAIAAGWVMTKLADEPTLRLLKRMRIRGTAPPAQPVELERVAPRPAASKIGELSA
ncbi:MAG TPA: acyltransferase [Alphaproteobacteria bacterium]|nr:acyltransferase [Alphaproteobacteria bacterium]